MSCNYEKQEPSKARRFHPIRVNAEDIDTQKCCLPPTRVVHFRLHGFFFWLVQRAWLEKDIDFGDVEPIGMV